uniref:Uncharacterized protein n=1 Tax=Trichobilharzia regenti TaxID=157069 RepID=A0AA85IYD6_TRIRE|nr:unnamed protein product [Trichobilharzia regenti]
MMGVYAIVLIISSILLVFVKETSAGAVYEVEGLDDAYSSSMSADQLPSPSARFSVFIGEFLSALCLINTKLSVFLEYFKP